MARICRCMTRQATEEGARARSLACGQQETSAQKRRCTTEVRSVRKEHTAQRITKSLLGKYLDGTGQGRLRGLQGMRAVRDGTAPCQLRQALW